MAATHCSSFTHQAPALGSAIARHLGRAVAIIIAVLIAHAPAAQAGPRPSESERSAQQRLSEERSQNARRYAKERDELVARHNGRRVTGKRR